MKVRVCEELKLRKAEPTKSRTYEKEEASESRENESEFVP